MAEEIPNQGEMDFGEWIATLIAHGMNNQEILTYLEPDTREEDLVALVRLIMTERKEDELPEMVRISAAAIRLPDQRVFVGRMHGDIIQYFPGKVSIGLANAGVHGFITNEHRFVSRKEAREIAVSAGQVPETITELYSEELMEHDKAYWPEGGTVDPQRDPTSPERP